jgi:hypothetical protein
MKRDDYFNQVVTCRKDHQCANCGAVIQAGEEAIYMETRFPVYDKDFIQTGINYWKAWFCLTEEKCLKHKKIENKEKDDV